MEKCEPGVHARLLSWTPLAKFALGPFDRRKRSETVIT